MFLICIMFKLTTHYLFKLNFASCLSCNLLIVPVHSFNLLHICCFLFMQLEHFPKITANQILFPYRFQMTCLPPRRAARRPRAATGRRKKRQAASKRRTRKNTRTDSSTTSTSRAWSSTAARLPTVWVPTRARRRAGTLVRGCGNVVIN